MFPCFQHLQQGDHPEGIQVAVSLAQPEGIQVIHADGETIHINEEAHIPEDQIQEVHQTAVETGH